MSEGKFKQLIRLNEGTGRVLHSRLVESWVEEAKKELRKITDFYDETGYLPPKVYMFEKRWFGDKDG